MYSKVFVCIVLRAPIDNRPTNRQQPRSQGLCQAREKALGMRLKRQLFASEGATLSGIN